MFVKVPRRLISRRRRESIVAHAVRAGRKSQE
jgi:hypothetical protein